ncbi:MAG: hypothetical protein EBW82_04510 [Verrucomicrobia bacterium]|nr:hypothetical protein [Verrucomicrobiota bacterium]
MWGAYAFHPLNFSFEIFIGSVGKISVLSQRGVLLSDNRQKDAIRQQKFKERLNCAGYRSRPG